MEHFLTHDGYFALVLLAFIEASCVPIPSEITFGFAGALAATHRLDLAAVIVFGTIAELVGSYFTYFVGRFGGRRFVEKAGRYVLLTSKDLDRADRWFAGRGEYAVAVGRATPVIRAFVSLVAGIGEMPAVRFGVFSGLGTLAYCAALSSIGYAVGLSWHRVVHGVSIAGYVIVAAIVVVIATFIVHRARDLRRERAELEARAQ